MWLCEKLFDMPSESQLAFLQLILITSQCTLCQFYHFVSNAYPDKMKARNMFRSK